MTAAVPTVIQSFKKRMRFVITLLWEYAVSQPPACGLNITNITVCTLHGKAFTILFMYTEAKEEKSLLTKTKT